MSHIEIALDTFARKRQALGTYLYWSSRLVRETIDANPIMPGGRLKWSISTLVKCSRYLFLSSK